MNDSDLKKETRFAVIMYGGVSLAVYINGIAQELYRMVSATANPSDASANPRPWGSEPVYKKIGAMLKTRFVVDILSGTSAGGINGIFLAKALANGQSFKSLEQLWLDEGNIEVLINDEKSKDRGCRADVAYPRSLLNSERMYNHLRDAFDQMDENPSKAGKAGAPLVDELDLYVTATDLQGFPVPLKLSDIVVLEKEHRNTFHFHFKKGSASDNDFIRDNNPFLAFAARCTSAFPFAFEPIRLQDIPESARHPQWSRFYEKYLLDSDHCGKNAPPDLPVINGKYDVFTKRSFADGGYLDNKPFSYAINAITSRSSGVPIDRKLIYIEPSPDVEPDPCTVEGPPNAVENVGKVFSLAIYETIQEDLRRVIDRNRLIERVNRILKGTTDDFLKKEGGPETAVHWYGSYLKDMIAREGIHYGGYLRLRVAQLTDDLTEIITRHAGFDVQSDFFLAVRYIVRAWRDARYEYDRADDAKASGKKSFNRFLYDHDLGFMIRRLGYTISVIDTVLSLAEIWRQAAYREKLPDAEKGRLIQEYGELFFAVVEPLKTPEEIDNFVGRLRDIRRELSQKREAIYDLHAMLFSPGKRKAPSDEMQRLMKAFGDVKIKPAEMMEKILGKSSESGKHPTARSESESYNAARILIEEAGRIGQLDRVADIVRQVVRKADDCMSAAKVKLGLEMISGRDQRETASVTFKALSVPATVAEMLDDQALTATKEFEHWAQMEKASRLATWLPAIFFRRFMWYDEIAYPIIQFSGVGQELDEVEIVRISPNDAQSLSDRGVNKLGGTALMHFGAFLDRTWRKNDILWGRLDGAERIIKALLAGADEKAIDDLVKEAHLAIIQETFFERREDDQGGEDRLRVQETIDLLLQFILGKNNEERRNKKLKVMSGQNRGLYKAIQDLMDKISRGEVGQEKGCRCNRAADDEIVKSILGKILGGKITKETIYYWLKGYEVNKDVNPQLALESITRSTEVLGKMLGVMSNEYGALKRPAAWLTRLGAFAWGLVEASIPKSLLDLLTRKLTSLVTLIAVILIAGGIFIHENAVERIGIWLLIGALIFTLLKFYLRSFLMKRRLPALIRRLLTALLALAIFTVLGVGILYLPEALKRLTDALQALYTSGLR